MGHINFDSLVKIRKNYDVKNIPMIIIYLQTLFARSANMERRLESLSKQRSIQPQSPYNTFILIFVDQPEPKVCNVSIIL